MAEDPTDIDKSFFREIGNRIYVAMLAAEVSKHTKEKSKSCNHMLSSICLERAFKKLSFSGFPPLS